MPAKQSFNGCLLKTIFLTTQRIWAQLTVCRITVVGDSLLRAILSPPFFMGRVPGEQMQVPKIPRHGSVPPKQASSIPRQRRAVAAKSGPRVTFHLMTSLAWHPFHSLRSQSQAGSRRDCGAGAANSPSANTTLCAYLGMNSWPWCLPTVSHSGCCSA